VGRHDLVQGSAPEPTRQGTVERQGAVAEPDRQQRSVGCGATTTRYASGAGPAGLDPGDGVAQPGDVG